MHIGLIGFLVCTPALLGSTDVAANENYLAGYAAICFSPHQFSWNVTRRRHGAC